MQIRKVPQSCHSGKRWIWILEALSNTNPSKKLTVRTISGFTMGHPQLATRLIVPYKIFKLRFIDGDVRSTPPQTSVSVTDNGVNGNPDANRIRRVRHGKIYYAHKSQCAKYTTNF